MSQSPPIIYTWTDEAPALATYAFLPIIRAFAGATGVPVETRDISLAGRLGKYGLGIMKKKAKTYGEEFAEAFRERAEAAE